MSSDPDDTDADGPDETVAAARDRAAELGHATGDAIGTAAGAAVWGAAAFGGKAATGTLYGVTRVFPKAETVWRSVFETSLKRMLKSSGGDVVGFVAGQDQTVRPTPMAWQDGDEKTSPGWYDKDGNWWAPGTEGRSWSYINDVPVAPFALDSPWRGSWLQNEVAEAVELGDTDALFKDAEFYCELEAKFPENGGAPIADGGAEAMRMSGVELAEAGVLDDELVDLSTPEDASGRRVSWTKYTDLFLEQTGTEEMQMQEQRGRISESDPEAQRSMWMRIMLYMVVAVVAAAVGPELIAALFGNVDMSSVSPI